MTFQDPSLWAASLNVRFGLREDGARSCAANPALCPASWRLLFPDSRYTAWRRLHGGAVKQIWAQPEHPQIGEQRLDLLLRLLSGDLALLGKL